MGMQLISREEFASVQQVQAGVSRLLQKAAKERKFLRVMRNQEPLGVLIPNEVWNELLEDFEAANSANYQQMVVRARKSKKKYSAVEIKKELGLD